MTGRVGIKRNNISILVEHMPQRKKPCLTVQKANCIYKVASFNSEETADWFLGMVEEMLVNRDGEVKMMTDWILTKDRKPPTDSNVLVTYVTRYGFEYVVTAYFGSEKFYIYALTADFGEDRVPAWMPLPEPYGGE